MSSTASNDAMSSSSVEGLSWVFDEVCALGCELAVCELCEVFAFALVDALLLVTSLALRPALAPAATLRYMHHERSAREAFLC